MIPTAARLAGYSAARNTVKRLGQHESNAARLVRDTAGWAVCFGIFMGWCPAIGYFESRHKASSH